MKYLSKMLINNQEKSLYVCLNENGNTFNYYLDNKIIGAYTTTVPGEKIIFKESEELADISEDIKEEIRNKVNEIDFKELREELLEYRKKNKINELAHVLGEGYENEDITRIAEVELEEQSIEDEEEQEQIEENEESQEQESDEEKIEDDKESQEKLEEDLENQEEIEDEDNTKETTRQKNVVIKQEIKLNSKVNEIKTLGQILRGKISNFPLDAKKLVVIESSKKNRLLQDKNSKSSNIDSARYSLAVVDSKGIITPLNIEVDETVGTNPTQENYQLKGNGEVEKEDVLCRYKIAGNETISIKNGQYGEIEVFYSPGKTRSGNKSFDKQLETNNVWPIKTQIRDTVGEYNTEGNRQIDRAVKEADEHFKEHPENMDYRDADGIEETSSCYLSKEQCIEILSEVEEISDVYNRAYVTNMLEKYIEKNKIDENHITQEELEKIQKEIEEEAEREHDMGLDLSHGDVS